MRRRNGKVVALLDQTDLAEELVDCGIGNVDAGKRSNPFRFLAKVVDGGPAALAGEEVCLELARLRNLELSVDIAAQGEEAAPHSAISR